ncbi:MAG: NACHT domain-containing protein [Nostoc sp. TH1S01]|nr:NACHT domain-containing protein [Nostoc sp. TH1S01]
MENKIGAFIGAIARFATPFAKKQIDRSQLIISLKQQFPFLEDEHLPDEFGTVYARALFDYALLGKDLNLLLVQIFDKEEIKRAFRTEFEQNNLSILEKEIENLVNWEELDWNTLAEELRNIEQEQNIKVDIHKEIEDFRKAFYKALLRTFKPSQVFQNRQLQEILNKIDNLENLDAILAEIKQIPQLLSNLQAKSEAFQQQNDKKLDPRIEETLKLYLTKSFNDDSFAELDQAGETDPERRTPLKQVFTDLDVKTRQGIQPCSLKLENFPDMLQNLQPGSTSEEDSLPAIDCLLKECCSKVVIIGGPGQGKSTLGQQLAQVHRAKLLCKPYDFEPLVERIPFRVVLKYFAQELANKPDSEEDDLETYLAERVGKLAARPGSISARDIQEVLRCRPCLLILDGLDEVLVTELQKRMLSRIQDFIERAEVLGANIMVVATSRPNIYENQFEPEKFWHLELQPLSTAKVKTYAGKWIQAKNLSEEEQNRIVSTLEECQQDSNISALLTTPLQVTIILLIIKDGGRPPSQREALFNEYWITIFRREKSKAKGVIQSDESVLFDLHAYLGYLLHRRASEENVQSLLPEEDFSQAIRTFLRKEDRRSSEETINSKMRTLLQDAQERLILIVAPEPGLFGFELRSFQEFFAAVHLAQTASDTQQRFARFNAIACSQHWRNVALFFAGRIARNFRGEASNILELVCRVVDRGEPNHYLKPGAWLALEIASDGALSDNRDLQYNAVDYGLDVLDTGLTVEEQQRLGYLTNRLSNEDKYDIFLPALEEKINSLPLSRLMISLDIYAQHFGSNSFFQEKLDILIQSQRKDIVSSALNLALKYQTTSSWILTRLENNWFCWDKDISNLWNTSQEYTERLLHEFHLSESQAMEIAKATYPHTWYPHFAYNYQPVWELPTPKNISEQLILMMKCIQFVTYLQRQSSLHKILIPEVDIEVRLVKPQPLISIPDKMTKVLDNLLQDSNLLELPKLYLWIIFWYINEPNYENISNFFKCLCKNEQILKNTDIFRYTIYSFRENRPILYIAFRYYKEQGNNIINKLLPFLDSKTHISIAQELVDTIQQSIEQSEQQKLIVPLVTRVGLSEIFPQLVALANQIDISIDDLLDYHIRGYSFKNFQLQQLEITTRQIQYLLDATEDINRNSNKLINLLWTITDFTLPYNLELYRQLEQLLELMIQRWSSSSEFSIYIITCWFLKLLDYGYKPDKLACLLFTKIPQKEFLNLIYFSIREGVANWSMQSLSVLKSFLYHEQEAVRIGTAIIVKALINFPENYRGIDVNKIEQLKNIRLSADMGWNYANSDDSDSRLVGIALLSLSNYPIEDKNYRNKLLQLLQQHQNSEEEEALANFLKEIPISTEKHSIWLNFLEKILRQPWDYTNLILNAAMERYQTLTSPVGSKISEEKEKGLGLL